MPATSHKIFILSYFMFLFILNSCIVPVKGNTWPPQVKEIQYISLADKTAQPAMFYTPQSEKPVPLLVALHTWSGDYKQTNIEYAKWCLDKGWVMIHPNFRGPNHNPDATGSDKVVKDILSAVDYAKANANVDTQRIYLAGLSGGGYASLLMAGRAPEVWAGVSAWVPITDLRQWYLECKKVGIDYAEEIANSCGGPPDDGFAVDFEYKSRSPLTYLKNAKKLPLDINAGITDGHTGSVPISHSLRAFNVVAAEKDRFSEKDIKYLVEKAKVPPHLKKPITDPLYKQNPPLLRRQSGNARVTIFDGGHDMVYYAALAWLSKQKKTKDDPMPDHSVKPNMMPIK